MVSAIFWLLCGKAIAPRSTHAPVADVGAGGASSVRNACRAYRPKHSAGRPQDCRQSWNPHRVSKPPAVRLRRHSRLRLDAIDAIDAIDAGYGKMPRSL